MFEIGFSELCMIGLVSLLVIGPERLPKVARVVGFWLGKARAISANLKAEISHELQVEEMKQLMEQQKAQLQAVENDAEHLFDLTHSVPDATRLSEKPSQSEVSEKS